MAAAQLGNASYALADTSAGWRKTSLDLFQKIVSISPRDYPVYSMTGNTRTNNVTVTWHRRDLPARAIRTSLEGAAFDFETIRQPTRFTNTCQIIEIGVEVTGTAEAESHYGIKGLFNDQMDHRQEEWKGSAEISLIRATEETGDSDTERQMDGLLASITTIASTNSNNTLTETQFISLQEAIWQQGTKAKDVLTNSGIRRTIDQFDAQGKTSWEAPHKATEVTNMLLYYQGTFGTVRMHLSRDMENGNGTAELVMADFSRYKKVWLRPVFVRPIDSQADSKQAAIVGELSLMWDDERAAGKITALGVE